MFILEDLKDANIVQFLGACFEEGSTMLVTGAAPSDVPCCALEIRAFKPTTLETFITSCLLHHRMRYMGKQGKCLFAC